MGLVYFYILAFQMRTAFMGTFLGMATDNSKRLSVILYKYTVFKHSLTVRQEAPSLASIPPLYLTSTVADSPDLDCVSVPLL